MCVVLNAIMIPNGLSAWSWRKMLHIKCTTDAYRGMNEQFRLPETALIKRDLCTIKLTSMLQARLCNFSNGVFADVTELVCEPVSLITFFWLRLQRLLSRMSN